MRCRQVDYPASHHTPTALFAWAERLASRHGAAGRAWLQALPAQLDAAQHRWGCDLRPEPPVATSAHLLLPAVMADGQAVLVKLGWPDRAFRLEWQTLRHWGKGGAPVPAVRAVDDALAGMVLGRVWPGDLLRDVSDDATALHVWASVAARLHAARVPEGEQVRWPHLRSWLADLDVLAARQTGRRGVPPALIDTALHFRAQLLATPAREVLLHGDLHDANILRGADDTWWAIDPKGVVGDPAYDTAPFLINRLERWRCGLLREDVQRLLGAAAAALGVEEQRVARWLLVHAVLSSWWLIQDGTDDEASRATRAFRLHLAERLGNLVVDDPSPQP